MDCLFPVVTEENVAQLLQEQRFVILQGPPGTGKTRMAEKLLDEKYDSNGFSIQFHPNTTYESFIGGLSPETVESELGFRFEPKEGALLRAIDRACENPNNSFLLHIDEVNRADLARVLGEAIYLFEMDQEKPRKLELQHNFPKIEGREITIPDNLHVLGTMNTADESIASLDVAIRRRFSFADIWPSMSVVEEKGSERMVEAFRELLDIFVEYAPENNLNLLPGHSYFLENDSEKSLRKLRVRVKPLLEDYLQQGFVSGFEEPIRAYLQWIEGLQSTS
jgi:5-methylcytosine-specific restriction protein B